MSEQANLPMGRLHSMIAGAFRYGAESERNGKITNTEIAYAYSEDHARKLVEEFVKTGHVTSVAATEAKPVGYVNATALRFMHELKKHLVIELHQRKTDSISVPLYTHPPGETE